LPLRAKGSAVPGRSGGPHLVWLRDRLGDGSTITSAPMVIPSDDGRTGLRHRRLRLMRKQMKGIEERAEALANDIETTAGTIT
jgi:hypothetical protein